MQEHLHFPHFSGSSKRFKSGAHNAFVVVHFFLFFYFFMSCDMCIVSDDSILKVLSKTENAMRVQMKENNFILTLCIVFIDFFGT
jgi:hypothetical protein